MPQYWFAGFDTGDASECQSTSGTVSFVTSPVAGTNSTYSLRSNPTTTNVGWAAMTGRTGSGTTSASLVAASNSDGLSTFFKFDFRIGLLPAVSEVFASFASSLELRITAAGLIELYNNVPTLLATGVTTLTTGVWYRVEIKVTTTSGFSAVMTVRVDGVNQFQTSVDLSSGATPRLGKVVDRNGGSVDFYYDDFVFKSESFGIPGASWIGDAECYLLLPTANGTDQTWSIGAGSGSHYQVVDEVPPSSADYLLSTLVNLDKETESLANTTGTPITDYIASVQPTILVARDGASAGSIRLQSRWTGNTPQGSSYSPTAAYASIAFGYLTDTYSWTKALLDTLEVGAENRSTTNRTRMSFVSGDVLYFPALPAPDPLTLPVVSGTINVGDVLSVTNGTWQWTPTSYSYLWRHSDGSAAAGTATNSTYTLAAGDAGYGMLCLVTATNATGGTQVSSNTVGPVTSPAPVNTVAPAVTPTAGVVGDTFTSTTGTWTNSPSSYVYQWKLNGSDIGGATSSTYVAISAGSLTCVVTASNAGGPGTPATSNAATVTLPAGDRSRLLLLGAT